MTTPSIATLLLAGFFILAQHGNCSASPQAKGREQVSAVLSSNINKDVMQFLSGREPSSVTQYKHRNARRGVISFILLRQALHLGGVKEALNIRTEKVFMRNLNYAAEGKVTLIGEPVWLRDVENYRDKFYISAAIIREGEFVAGLYTRPNHPLIKSPPNKYSLKNYSALSNRNWKSDWALLEQLELKSIQHSLFWSNIIKMVYAGRADFTLAPFQDTADLTISAYGVTLKAIPEVKVVFDGSRHFVVSRKHPLGESTFGALETGLAILRREGTITRAYTEAGVFSERSKNWPALNTPQTPDRTTTSDHQEFDNPRRDHLPQPLQP